MNVIEDAYGKTKGSLEHWRNNRNKLSDLYASERYFLESVMKNTNSILDVGCAAGGGYCFSKEANPHIKYIGVDVSSELIEIAKIMHDEGDFHHFNGHVIPFSDNAFDCVFSIGVMHHLLHWKEMINEMVRCSRKHVVFDLRLTKNKTIADPNQYFQKIQFNTEMWDNKTVIPYLVINKNEFVDFLSEHYDNSHYRVESYGYFSKPTELANIPYDKIYMCSIKIELDSEYPGIFFNKID